MSAGFDLITLPAGAVVQLVTKSTIWCIVLTEETKSMLHPSAGAMLNGIVAYPLGDKTLKDRVMPEQMFFSRHLIKGVCCQHNTSWTHMLNTSPVVEAFRLQGGTPNQIL